jgi:5-methyltetrahydrofolate--homocysteine methyltransferase
MSKQQRDLFVEQTRAEYVRLAEAHAGGARRSPRVALADARANGLALDWSGYTPPAPTFLGSRILRPYPAADLATVIDWSPFFATWDLHGKFPAILDHPQFGEAARSLYDDALAMLDLIVRDEWFDLGAAVGFWPANRDGDDIVVFADERRTTPRAVLHGLRQQMSKVDQAPHLCLADFVSPARNDFVGAFTVTTGPQEEDRAAAFVQAHDDYSSIMVKALADRLAEAFAERLHQLVRTSLWAYAPDEQLTSEQLIAEEYQGIRPAPGYPSQPDHTEKETIFDLLGTEEGLGVKLTESYAMWPGSSVTGLYFSHSQSRYFGVGKIDRDQVEDYAARKGWRVAEAERWLAPSLSYTPD